MTTSGDLLKYGEKVCEGKFFDGYIVDMSFYVSCPRGALFDCLFVNKRTGDVIRTEEPKIRDEAIRFVRKEVKKTEESTE